MSRHLDTQLARQNGQLYIDDLYVFSGNQRDQKRFSDSKCHQAYQFPPRR